MKMGMRQKKWFIALVGILCIGGLLALLVVLLQGDGTFAGGRGTKEDPYLISTRQHLENMKKYPDAYFKQTEDIVLEGVFVSPFHENFPFRGYYDGGHYTISGLRLTAADEEFLGLFGYVEQGATLSNIILTDVSIDIVQNDNIYAGALAGICYGDIENCGVTGTIRVQSIYGEVYVGGLVGRIAGDIINSVSHVDITGEGPDGVYVGGLAGESYGLIKNSYNTGDVHSTDMAGGLCGTLSEGGKLFNVYNRGAVTGSSYWGSLTARVLVGDVRYGYYPAGTVPVGAYDQHSQIVGLEEKTVTELNDAALLEVLRLQQGAISGIDNVWVTGNKLWWEK